MMDRGSFDQPAMLAIVLRFDALEVVSRVRDVKESMLLLKTFQILRLTNLPQRCTVPLQLPCKSGKAQRQLEQKDIRKVEEECRATVYQCKL